jgi:hypothetical protein
MNGEKKGAIIWMQNAFEYAVYVNAINIVRSDRKPQVQRPIKGQNISLGIFKKSVPAGADLRMPRKLIKTRGALN